MPVLRINALGDMPVLHDTLQPLRPALTHAVQDPGPVIIMLHGYKFRPHDSKHCPHGHIFALNDHGTNRHAISWPRRLGMAAGRKGEGLAIAFGWNARGTLWQARTATEKAAKALATLVRMIQEARPDRAVHLLSHSLGGALGLQALKMLEPGDIGRVIVMNGALYRAQAMAALATPAGRSVELINVTSRENAVYDLMFESLVWPAQKADKAIGRGFSAANAQTLDLGDQAVLGMLAAQGFPIARQIRRHCHWSPYLRPGIFNLYQALLRNPDTFSLCQLAPARLTKNEAFMFRAPANFSIPEISHQA